jgi:hypothetical protein
VLTQLPAQHLQLPDLLLLGLLLLLLVLLLHHSLLRWSQLQARQQLAESLQMP